MEAFDRKQSGAVFGIWKYLRIVYFDALFLIKQGFLVAYAIVILAYVAVLSALPPSIFRTGFLIFAVYSDTAIIGFYFSAAMMFLEKDQHLLVNWSIMPVGWRHYVVSKLLTFSILSIVISLCLYLPFIRVVRLPQFCLGVFLSVLLNIPLGIILASNMKKLLNFLLLSVTVLFPQIFPLIDFYGLYNSMICRLLPGYGILLLLGNGQEAFTGGISLWYLVSSVVVSAALVFFSIRYLSRRQTGGAGGTI